MHMWNLPFRTLGTLGTVAVVALLGWTNASRSTRYFGREIPSAIDAPFRDGVFHGRLAAERCRPPLAPVGRWSHPTERARFADGYTAAFAVATRMNGACAPDPEETLSQR